MSVDRTWVRRSTRRGGRRHGKQIFDSNRPPSFHGNRVKRAEWLDRRDYKLKVDALTSPAGSSVRRRILSPSCYTHPSPGSLFILPHVESRAGSIVDPPADEAAETPRHTDGLVEVGKFSSKENRRRLTKLLQHLVALVENKVLDLASVEFLLAHQRHHSPRSPNEDVRALLLGSQDLLIGRNRSPAVEDGCPDIGHKL